MQYYILAKLEYIIVNRLIHKYSSLFGFETYCIDKYNKAKETNFSVTLEKQMIQ